MGVSARLAAMMKSVAFVALVALVAVVPFQAAQVHAQNVDVVPEKTSVRLVTGTNNIGQTIYHVFPAGEITFYATNTPITVFAVNSTQMRFPSAGPVTPRNVTLPTDSIQSGVILGDALYFFGFEKIYRVDISQIKASPTYQWDPADITTLSYQRSGEAPFPDFAFAATVNGVEYGYFIASAINPIAATRDIVILNPNKFNEGQQNATSLKTISGTLSFQGVSAGVNTALFAFADPVNDRTEIRVWDVATQVVTKSFYINKLTTGRQTIFYDETYNYLWVAGQNTTLDADNVAQLQPMLFRVDLNKVDAGVAYDGSVCDTIATCNGAVHFVQIGFYNEEVRAIGIDHPNGTVFVALFDGYTQGSVVRVNPKTLVLAEVGIYFSQARQNPFVLSVDPATQFLYAGLELDVVSFNYPTICPSQCNIGSGLGICVEAQCVCHPDYEGEACDLKKCAGGCGESTDPLVASKGFCNNGVCLCAANFTGTNCQERQCPSNCTGRGTCVKPDANLPDGWYCKCEGIYRGVDCTTLSYFTCPQQTNVRDCVDSVGCGWCVERGSCSVGNQVGPVNGTCEEWLTGNTKELGTFAVAIIFIIIFGIMVILNVLSAIAVDFQTASYLNAENLLTVEFLKETYWRDERSAKAWKLFDQLQFISYFSLIGVAFPSRMMGFTRYFNWAMLLFPLPSLPKQDPFHPERDLGFVAATPSNAPVSSAAASVLSAIFGSEGLVGQITGGRSLLNFEQVSSGLGYDLDRPFYSVMIYFAVLLGILLVGYTIWALLFWALFKSKEPTYAVVLRQKVFYVITRVVLIGYMPICITAAYHLRSDWGAARAGSAIALVVFGIIPDRKSVV